MMVQNVRGSPPVAGMASVRRRVTVAWHRVPWHSRRTSRPQPLACGVPGAAAAQGSRRITVSSQRPPPPISVVVHGGAWSIPDELKDRNLRACELAADEAYAILQTGGKAVDAVEAAVRSLELDDSLNAGFGCSLNEFGEPECDALIMDGWLRLGAVAGVQVPHPITLARRVMERTEHVMLSGEGAMRFAESEGLSAAAGMESLISPLALEEWQTWREYRSNVQHLFAAGGEPSSSSSSPRCSSTPDASTPGDTVGCVALDSEGMVACGTSTGGVVGKRKGRVGDSPLVGSGGYADVHLGAVSTTGHGEAIARVTLARLALWLIQGSGQERVRTAQQAATAALQTMRQRCGETGGGTGGLIMVTPTGEVAKAFTTQRMPWASRQGEFGAVADARMSGIERDS